MKIKWHELWPSTMCQRHFIGSAAMTEGELRDQIRLCTAVNIAQKTAGWAINKISYNQLVSGDWAVTAEYSREPEPEPLGVG